ncbi:MAG: bifunctional UDP-N-acetylglucosamine diphosphorylase/glucosamine-1-phosphate N-acetyltransferase GlmU [Alicyclobacillus herbarius]|nr:bifunctional UDP-N-acetylglucosamine diphosphorylase/glucosamine-1-phosphate N-acetyltransferase GlmU [Alicyclobacillus herbarius]
MAKKIGLNPCIPLVTLGLHEYGGDVVGRTAIVLAAGLGTRMKSKKHKVLHEVCGKPMILHILDELKQLDLDQILVVVGQARESVMQVVGGRAEFAVQEEQKGTGHAVLSAWPQLRPDADTVLVLYGDGPLIRAETLRRMCDERERRGAAAVLLTAEVNQPKGLGRVILAEDGTVERIVEEKDATPEERQIRRINTGLYAFAASDLGEVLGKLSPNNQQGEYYLTDAAALLRQQGKRVYPLQVADVEEIASVNDRAQLATVEQIMRRRICQHWMLEGVTLIDPERTYIGADVVIGRDTVVYPGTILEGRTVIGEDCVIGPNTRLVDAVVERGARVESSVVLESQVGAETNVGPFAYIRPGSVIGSRVKIGDFVEIKKSIVGDDTKVSHLTYIGDAEIGRRVNVGCGAVTVNYDGEKKHLTRIGDDSFIGCNVNLVAPVSVGEGAYVAAGSTITDAVPDDGFAIARARQVTKPEYVRAWKQRHAGKSRREDTK